MRDELENELSQLEARCLERTCQGIDNGPVFFALFVPHRVRVILAQQTLSDFGAAAGHLAERLRVGNRLTVERAAGVDHEAVIGGAIAADGVEGLEGETERIHLAMATVASRLTPVNFQPLS